MVTCSNPKCGRENEDHYKYCLGCGSPLAAPAPVAQPQASGNCTQCGAALTAGQRFCVSCGFAVAAITVNAGTPGPTSANAPTIDTAATATQEPTPAAATTSEPQAAAPAPQPETANVPTAEPLAASPQAPASDREIGRLIMVNPDRSIGGVFPLKQGENIVGRSCGYDVFTRDEYLSPEHAVFTVDGARITVRDLNSVNGVYVRTQEIVELQSGAYFRLGKGVFTFETIENFPRLVETNPDGTTPSAGRAAGVWGRIARVSGPPGFASASNAWLLHKEEVIIGRERGDITLNDDNYVSGTHARVFRHDGRIFLEDLQSSNGTYKRIQTEVNVGNGSFLLIGEQPFRLQLTE